MQRLALTSTVLLFLGTGLLDSTHAQTANLPESGFFPPVPERISSTAALVSESEPGERLVVSGVVYKSDGKTPYEGLILYLYQTDAAGYYNKTNSRRVPPRLHGWVKTDARGRYEFRTIKPGSYPRSTIPAHIHVQVIKADDQAQSLDEYLFAGDPYLSRAELAQGVIEGDFSNIMKLAKDKDGVFHCTRNFVITSK